MRRRVSCAFQIDQVKDRGPLPADEAAGLEIARVACVFRHWLAMRAAEVALSRIRSCVSFSLGSGSLGRSWGAESLIVVTLPVVSAFSALTEPPDGERRGGLTSAGGVNQPIARKGVLRPSLPPCGLLPSEPRSTTHKFPAPAVAYQLLRLQRPIIARRARRGFAPGGKSATGPHSASIYRSALLEPPRSY